MSFIEHGSEADNLTEEHNPRKSSKKIAIASGIGVAIIITGIVAYLAITNPRMNGGASVIPSASVIPPPPIQIGGYVLTVGTGTKPIAVSFVDVNSKATYNGVVTNGGYSITVPNESWQFVVTVFYTGPLNTKGNCVADPLTTTKGYNGPQITHNLRC